VKIFSDERMFSWLAVPPWRVVRGRDRVEQQEF
jgi:hypothetical protein